MVQCRSCGEPALGGTRGCLTHQARPRKRDQLIGYEDGRLYQPARWSQRRIDSKLVWYLQRAHNYLNNF